MPWNPIELIEVVPKFGLEVECHTTLNVTKGVIPIGKSVGRSIHASFCGDAQNVKRLSQQGQAYVNFQEERLGGTALLAASGTSSSNIKQMLTHRVW